MNLTDTAFIELLTARSLTVQVESKNALDSLRVMLYRKLQAHIKQWDDVGYLNEELRDATVSVEVAEGGKIATISIIKRRPRLQFTILKVGDSSDEEVPTNLGNNQEGKIQHRSADHDSPEHGEDTDPGSSQGESNGQCSSPEDWQSQLRAFIQQDSDTPDEA